MEQSPPADNRPVFVQAYPRSGTTLFVTILNAHPELAMSYEIYQNLLMDSTGGPYPVGELLAQLRRHEQPDGSKWVRALPGGHWRSFVARARRADVDVEELRRILRQFHDAGGTFETLDGRLDFIDSLMRYHRDKAGKQLWGGKVAKVPLEELLRRHPEARFLFVVRDGRDVLASRLNVGEFQTTAGQCAREWRGRIESFRAFREAFPNQAKEIRYESLVTQPERTLQEVCHFLGIEYAPQMLEYHRGDLSVVRNAHGHLSAQQIARGLNRENIGRWKRDLSAEQVWQFEIANGGMLEKYAYRLSKTKGDRDQGPASVSSAPSLPFSGAGYFPLQFYVDFLEHLRGREEIQFITYDDLAWQPNDSYEKNYRGEFRAWKKRLRHGELDPDKIYVLLQHDVDRLPELTMTVLREEQRLGVPSNVMIFHRRISRRHLRETGELLYTDYDLDVAHLRRLQDEHRFVIGYHCNTYERAVFDPGRAREIFREDVATLRQWFHVRYFSPHGGARDMKGQSNSSLMPPEELMTSLRWVQNCHGPRFDGQYSDGGLNNPRRDPEKRDLRDFVRTFRKGDRYRILTHPQYYCCDQCEPSPRMAGTRWYDDLLALYAEGSGRSAWDMEGAT